MAEHERQLRWRFLDWRPIGRREIVPPEPPPPAAPREPSEPPPPADPPASLRAGFADLEEFVREVGGGRIAAPRMQGRYVTVPMRARDDALYFLRLHVPRYLVAPPRCTFVDEHEALAPEAWPAYYPANPFRPPTFICSSPTAEYHELHPEHPYRRETGSLVNAVATIYTALQAKSYRGRHRGV